MINIPGQEKRFLQINDSDLLGNISETFNIDLTSNKGAIRTNRSKLVPNDDSDDFGVPIAIARFDVNNDLSNEYVVMTGTDTVSNGGIFIGGTDPNDTLTRDTTTGTPTTILRDRADMRVFNNKLYVLYSTNMERLSPGGNWTTIASPGLSLEEHHTCVMGDRMYYTRSETLVGSINTSEVVASTTGTLELSGFDNVFITFIIAGADRVWVGTVNSSGGQGSIFEWDGETQNTPTRQYKLNASGVLSGVMKDGVPYCMDTEGSLLAFTGNSFTKIAQLPVDADRSLFNINQLISNDVDERARYIHPNGMALIDGKINMLIRSTYEDGLTDVVEKLKSGIWEYTQENGLYHKNSASMSAVADSGTTNLTDHGQEILNVVGALEPAKAGGGATDRNGTYLFGASYYTDDQTNAYGIFIDDAVDTTQDWGYFVTTKLFSSGIQDTWQKIYAIYSKLINSTDKIVVKYKTEDDIPTETSIDWVSTNRFLTNTDLSDYSKGDEVQIIQGKGGGKSAHIKDITSVGSGYSVLLDDTFTGATGTAKARISRWLKAGEITQPNDKNQWKALTLPKKNTSPWIQFKVCMQFTGKNEVYGLRVINKTTINE